MRLFRKEGLEALALLYYYSHTGGWPGRETLGFVVDKHGLHSSVSAKGIGTFSLARDVRTVKPSRQRRPP